MKKKTLSSEFTEIASNSYFLIFTNSLAVNDCY